MPASRENLLAKLDDAYTVYFDKIEVDESVEHLAAAYAFHSTNECYVLSKKAKLWSAETHEYVYVFSVPVLTEETVLACTERAHALGMARIRPHIDHMSSLITALFVCDRAEDAAIVALEKVRIRKNFKFSLYGWMQVRTAVVEAESGRVGANRDGKDLKEFLRGNYEKIH